MNICSINDDDCSPTRKVTSWGWCATHYQRWRHHGDPFVVLPPSGPKKLATVCSINDGECSPGGRMIRGWCRIHYERWKTHGSPFIVLQGGDNPFSHLSGSDNFHWVGDDASYSTVHSRLNAARGNANQYQCVDCGQPARQWSYGHDDPNEMHSQHEQSLGMPYSTNLNSYAPRCRSCHKFFDHDRVC